MNDSVTDWLSLELPHQQRSTADVLGRYGLPNAYEPAFGALVRVLVAIGRITAPDGLPISSVRELGRAFHSLGGGDEEIGFRYMQAAHAAARDVYRFDLSILNGEWSGIGKWLA